MHPFIVHQINHLPPDIRRPFYFTRSLNKTGLQRIPECGYPMSRRIPRLTGARPTNEQTRLMNFTPYLADVAGRGVLISFRSAYGSLRPHPRFCFTSGHLSVCDGTDPVWSAQRLAGTVPLRPRSAGTASARRVCCVCWRALILLPAAILSAPPPLPRVAQQPTLTPETTLATLLGYASVLPPCLALNRAKGWPTISIC